jgi:hypothetical protein
MACSSRLTYFFMLGGGLSAKIPPQRWLSVPLYHSYHVGLALTGMSAQAAAREIKHTLCYQTEQQHTGTQIFCVS